MPDTEDRLFDVNEAAEYLNVKVRMIRRLITQRRVAFTKIGAHVRIARSDLDALKAAGRVEIGGSVR